MSKDSVFNFLSIVTTLLCINTDIENGSYFRVSTLFTTAHWQGVGKLKSLPIILLLQQPSPLFTNNRKLNFVFLSIDTVTSPPCRLTTSLLLI